VFSKCPIGENGKGGPQIFRDTRNSIPSTSASWSTVVSFRDASPLMNRDSVDSASPRSL
jgi:hypothetical protein